jgi:hypothetical protein
MNIDNIWAWILANKKTIIIIIIIIILLILIKKNQYKIRKFFNPMAEDNVPGALTDPSEQGGLSAARKVFIQNLANELYDDMNGVSWYPGSHDYEPYTKALGLYDDELTYLGNYYYDFLSDGKEKLSASIDGDTFMWGSTPNDLAVKLKALGV